jgi:ketosteroid isomerase-like protein
MSTSTELATAYFDAWRAKDTKALRPHLAEDVEFAGPLAEVTGADEYVESIRHLFDSTRGLEIVKVFADGPDVLTWFDLTVEGAPTTPVVNWCHVEDERITDVKVIFDPRGMLG